MTHSSQHGAEKFWVKWQTDSFKPHTECSWNLKTVSLFFLHCITSEEAFPLTELSMCSPVNILAGIYFHLNWLKEMDSFLWLSLGYCHVSSVYSKMLCLFVLVSWKALKCELFFEECSIGRVFLQSASSTEHMKIHKFYYRLLPFLFFFFTL